MSKRNDPVSTDSPETTAQIGWNAERNVGEQRGRESFITPSGQSQDAQGNWGAQNISSNSSSSHSAGATINESRHYTTGTHEMNNGEVSLSGSVATAETTMRTGSAGFSVGASGALLQATAKYKDVSMRVQGAQAQAGLHLGTTINSKGTETSGVSAKVGASLVRGDFQYKTPPVCSTNGNSISAVLSAHGSLLSASAEVSAGIADNKTNNSTSGFFKLGASVGVGGGLGAYVTFTRNDKQCRAVVNKDILTPLSEELGNTKLKATLNSEENTFSLMRETHKILLANNSLSLNTDKYVKILNAQLSNFLAAAEATEGLSASAKNNIQKLDTALKKQNRLLDGSTASAEIIASNNGEITKYLDAINNEVDTAEAELRSCASKLLTTNAEIVGEWTGENDVAAKDIKTREYAERINFDHTMSEMHAGFQCAGILVGLFGDRELARKISVVSSAAYILGTTIAGFAGYGTMAGTVAGNPLGGAFSILSSVSSLVDAFGSPGKTPDQMILESIQALSQQIEILRQEMHMRFDRLDEKMDQMLMRLDMGVNALQREQLHILAYLHHYLPLIQSKIEGTQLNVLKLHEKLNDIQYFLGKMSQRENVNKLKTEVYGYIHNIDRFKYVERMVELGKVSGCSSRDELYTDVPVTSTANLSADADFSIRRVEKIRENYLSVAPKNLPNPMVWSLTSLTMIYLTLIQYPDPEISDRNLRMADRDFDDIMKLLATAEDLKEFTTDLREPAVFDGLMRNYREKLEQFKQQLENHRQDHERDVLAKEVSQAVEQNCLQYNINQQESFLSSKVDVNASNGNWWQGRMEEFYKWYDGRAGWGPSAVRNEYVGRLQNGDHAGSYKYQQEESILRYKKEYVAQRSLSIVKVAKNINLQSDYANVCEMPWFMFSKKVDLPVLPLPKEVDFGIDKAYLEAAALGLGYFIFLYDVNGDKFTIDIFFTDNYSKLGLLDSANNGSCIAKIELAYSEHLNFYKSNERVWWYWVGGNYEDRPTPDMQLLGDYRMNGTHNHYKYWGYRPVAKLHPGMSDSVQYANAEKSISYPNEKENLAQVKALVSKFRAGHERRFTRGLMIDVNSSDSRPELAAAARELNEAYIDLMLVLNFAFKSEMQSSNELFEAVLLNTETFKRHLQSSDKSNLDFSAKFSDVCEKLSILEKMITSWRELHAIDGYSNPLLEMLIEIMGDINKNYTGNTEPVNQYHEDQEGFNGVICILNSAAISALFGIIEGMILKNIPSEIVDELAKGALNTVGESLSKSAVLQNRSPEQRTQLLTMALNLQAPETLRLMERRGFSFNNALTQGSNNVSADEATVSSSSSSSYGQQTGGRIRFFTPDVASELDASVTPPNTAFDAARPANG